MNKTEFMQGIERALPRDLSLLRFEASFYTTKENFEVDFREATYAVKELSEYWKCYGSVGFSTNPLLITIELDGAKP